MTEFYCDQHFCMKICCLELTVRSDRDLTSHFYETVCHRLTRTSRL